MNGRAGPSQPVVYTNGANGANGARNHEESLPTSISSPSPACSSVSMMPNHGTARREPREGDDILQDMTDVLGEDPNLFVDEEFNGHDEESTSPPLLNGVAKTESPCNGFYPIRSSPEGMLDEVYFWGNNDQPLYYG